MVNLAIIGSGIGGASAAYFARKYLPDSKITVYERENRVGGRVLTYDDGKNKTELGAAFFNFNNKLIYELVKELNLNIKRVEEAKDIALWNGNEVFFKASQPKFYNMLKLIATYKFNVPKLIIRLKEAQKKIQELYRTQTPTEFWELFENTNLDNWYRKRFDQILVEMGIDQGFINEIITPITRIIYSQDATLGGFAGLSSVLGVYGESVYSLIEGNDVLPSKLIEASNSNLELQSKVESIEKTSTDSFRVTVGGVASIFDGLIIASPLETANLTFDGFSNQELDLREYQKIYIRIMKGEIKHGFFNLDKSTELPAIILTTKEADPITRFSISKSEKNKSLVTITSKEPIGNKIVNKIFINGRVVIDHTWRAAYPVFNPIEKLPATCIYERLIYLNAIESAASSMESSIFAALNGIKMIKEQLH